MGVWDKIKSAAKTVGGYAIGGPVGAVTGAVGGKILGGAKDAFSTQDATAGQTTAADYQYGGSASLRNAQLNNLYQRGNASYSTLTDVGTQNYRDAMAGSSAIGAAGETALQTGAQAAAGAANLSGAARQAYDKSPTMFGSQNAYQQWGNVAGQIADYSPSARTTRAASALTGYDAGTVDSRLGDSYAQLQQYAQQGPGPSAAQAQLNQSLDANVASQIAMARSGRGAGANANAARQAAFQQANLGQQTAAQAATLRANEEATWRNQQLQAMNAAGGLAGNIESAQQGRQGIDLQALTSGAQISQSLDTQQLQAQQAAAGQYASMFGATADAQQAATAAKQGYLTQAMSGQQASAAQQANAYQQYLASLGTAAGLSQQAGQNNMAAQQAGLAARSAYDQQAISIYENEAQRRANLAMDNAGQITTASVANQKADTEQDARNIGLFSGLLESGIKAGKGA